MNDFGPLHRNNVTQTGNPDAGKTMVLLHGFGTDQTAWSEIVPAFKDDYRIILLDNVGAGKSDHSVYESQSGRYVTPRGFAEDLVEVASELGLKDAVVVGHSVGAMIAMLACNKSPGLCSRLVLLGASPRYLNDEGYHGGFTKEMIADIHLEMYMNSEGWAEPFARSAMRNLERPELHRHFARTLKSIPFERAASTLLMILRSDCRADVDKVNVPTLIIQAQDDDIVPPAVAEYLHQHIRGSRLAFINAAGHLPHVSAPAEVIRAMKEFGL